MAKTDIVCLCIALIGIVAWQTTKNPLLGLYFSILADFTGMVPSFIKTYRFPKTEIATFFALDFFASIFSLGATRIFTIENIAYPLYILFANAMMVVLILMPRRKTIAKI